MTAVIGILGQRGGQGKSSMARALATEAVRSGLNALLVDLDYLQKTSIDWSARRAAAGIDPLVPCRLAATVKEALVDIGASDLVVVDSPGRADEGMLSLARRATLVVLPTGASLDDLAPSIRVFHSLVGRGIPKSRMVYALARVQTDAEAAAARRYLEEAGYTVLPKYLPERPAYRVEQNMGRAITECRYPTLRATADALVQAVFDVAAQAA